MKGTATVTTKTTTTPVTVTDIRNATVVSATATSVTVRGADNVQRRFSQSELDKRGIEIFKDGQLVRASQLNPGDQLTATIVTSQAPTIVTETAVDAKLAPKAAPPPAKVEPAPAKMEPAKVEPAPAKMEPAKVEPAPAAVPPPPPVVATTTPVAPSAPPSEGHPAASRSRRGCFGSRY